jgi:hypothetical protein
LGGWVERATRPSRRATCPANHQPSPKNHQPIRVNSWLKTLPLKKFVPPISLYKGSVSLLKIYKEIKMKAPDKLISKEIPQDKLRPFPVSGPSIFIHQTCAFASRPATCV